MYPAAGLNTVHTSNFETSPFILSATSKLAPLESPFAWEAFEFDIANCLLLIGVVGTMLEEGFREEVYRRMAFDVIGFLDRTERSIQDWKGCRWCSCGNLGGRDVDVLALLSASKKGEVICYDRAVL